jgi:hypothetical protein
VPGGGPAIRPRVGPVDGLVVVLLLLLPDELLMLPPAVPRVLILRVAHSVPATTEVVLRLRMMIINVGILVITSPRVVLLLLQRRGFVMHILMVMMMTITKITLLLLLLLLLLRIVGVLLLCQSVWLGVGSRSPVRLGVVGRPSVGGTPVVVWPRRHHDPLLLLLLLLFRV